MQANKTIQISLALAVLAAAVASNTGCESAGKKTAYGAAAGAAAGGLLGAVVSKDKKNINFSYSKQSLKSHSVSTEWQFICKYS